MVVSIEGFQFFTLTICLTKHPFSKMVVWKRRHIGVWVRFQEIPQECEHEHFVNPRITNETFLDGNFLGEFRNFQFQNF